MENDKDIVSKLNKIVMLQKKKVDYQFVSIESFQPLVFKFSAKCDTFKGMLLKLLSKHTCKFNLRFKIHCYSLWCRSLKERG